MKLISASSAMRMHLPVMSGIFMFCRMPPSAQYFTGSCPISLNDAHTFCLTPRKNIGVSVMENLSVSP